MLASLTLVLTCRPSDSHYTSWYYCVGHIGWVGGEVSALWGHCSTWHAPATSAKGSLRAFKWSFPHKSCCRVNTNPDAGSITSDGHFMALVQCLMETA